MITLNTPVPPNTTASTNLFDLEFFKPLKYDGKKSKIIKDEPEELFLFDPENLDL